MLSRSVTSLTGLLMLVVFLCVSCASGPAHKGTTQERFYKGQQAEIVDLLRQSNQERLNNNIDKAIDKANEAMEKSTAIKDDTMRLSCGFWITTIRGNPGGIDSVPGELLKGDKFETLFYGYLLVMYDINAFDLRGNDPLGVLFGSMSGNDLMKSGAGLVLASRQAGDVTLADLVETMLTSYTDLLAASRDKNEDKVSEYTHKVLDTCDRITALADDPKALKSSRKDEFAFMARMFTLFVKLPVAGVDADMVAYEKAAKQYAKFVASVMPK
ncbi:MAG: hypothetical protein SFH39_03650 [Candidatus Magnetobacterium sp. LHC-1]|nr:hypothetical protein [Nitrospirota bacterium]